MKTYVCNKTMPLCPCTRKHKLITITCMQAISIYSKYLDKLKIATLVYDKLETAINYQPAILWQA